MGKPIVVLADLDESYLETFELKFLQELNEKIELEVITEKAYFDIYFSNPRRVELLVIGEEFYSQELQKHNIGNLYVLTETMGQGGTEELSVRKLYKYTSMKEIFNELLSEGLAGVIESEAVKKETQIIAVYSPIGGSGVTTMAVGLSIALAKNFKKVLFLSLETLQNFQYYLTNQGYLSNEACSVLKSGKQQLYVELKNYIRNEIFYYLPPLYASPTALGIQFSTYYKLLDDIKLSKDYDYIVLDMETGFQEADAELFSMVNKVIVVLQQDAFSVRKMENLFRSVELKDSEKFVFVCNCFVKEKRNYFVGSKLQSSVGIAEYIDELELEGIDNVLKLEKIEDWQRLSYLII